MNVRKPRKSSKPSSLSSCLTSLHEKWEVNREFAQLLRDWEKIVGKKLAPHCKALSLKNKILIIGASHPQWRQALQYNKNQLLATLNKSRLIVRNIFIRQYYPIKSEIKFDEKVIWSQHPSRVDIHGLGICKNCSRPAPQGELDLWSCCGFCYRNYYLSN